MPPVTHAADISLHFIPNFRTASANQLDFQIEFSVHPNPKSCVSDVTTNDVLYLVTIRWPFLAQG
jgi:hypothetical protein